MRKLIIAGLAAGFLTLAAAPAFAGAGPAGTSETDGPAADGGNQVSCGSPTDDAVVAAAPDGTQVRSDSTSQTAGNLVVCNDQGAVQGRIVVGGSADSGGYAYADGDQSNDPNAQGYARVNAGSGGISTQCGDVPNGDTDAANPSPGAPCAPSPV